MHTSRSEDRATLERVLRRQLTESVEWVARYGVEPYMREVAQAELDRRATTEVARFERES
jgi:hypothetical protein